jgi:cytochrome P450
MTIAPPARADAAPASASTYDRPRPAAPRPHLRRLGLFGALRAIKTNPIAVFAEEAYREPIVEYPELGGLLLVNDPDLIDSIYLGKIGKYVKSNQYKRVLMPALGDGLLTAEGETWQATRSITAPVFNPRAIAQMCESFCDCVVAMVRRWTEREDPRASVDLSAEIQRLTYDIFSGTVFSGALDDDRAAIHANMARYFDTIGRPDFATAFNLPVWVPTLARLRALPALSAFREIVDRAVDERIAENDREVKDLLDRLIRAHAPNSTAALSREMICDNIRTFLAAGHDTTGNALTWIIYLLALHPSVESRVIEELAEVVGDEPPSAEMLDRLVYTKAVVQEGLRLYPPVPITGRQATAEVELGGRRIKPTTPIVISSWVVHRHRDLWDSPEYFVPERFLPSAAGEIRRGAYIPFGLGPRICIGMGFAMQEILTVLATVMPRFRIRLARPEAVMPEFRATLRPSGGLPVFINSR